MDLKRNALCAAVAGLIVVASAGVVSAERGAETLEECKSALQFGIKSDLMLGSFESGGISFKRRLSPKSAIRYGIAVVYQNDETLAENYDFHTDFSVLYQRYIDPLSAAKFYWGLVRL